MFGFTNPFKSTFFKQKKIRSWKFNPKADITLFEYTLLNSSYHSPSGLPMGVVHIGFEEDMTPEEHFIKLYNAIGMGRHFEELNTSEKS